eukprot:15394092-Heterocapsa_arctica.AAC.1
MDAGTRWPLAEQFHSVSWARLTGNTLVSVTPHPSGAFGRRQFLFIGWTDAVSVQLSLTFSFP